MYSCVKVLMYYLFSSILFGEGREYMQHMRKRVAVCCSVLQGVAGRCSVFWYLIVRGEGYGEGIYANTCASAHILSLGVIRGGFG